MEKVILQSTDAEILDAASAGELEQVRTAFSVAVEKASGLRQAGFHRQDANQRLQQDIRWLRELARNQPKLRPRLAAVFGQKRNRRQISLGNWRVSCSARSRLLKQRKASKLG